MATSPEQFNTETVIMGKKGEILPKKKMRELLGFSPGDELILTVINGEMRIKKIPTIDEIFALPKFSSGTPQELKEEIRGEIKRQLG